ncbi:DEAD/DEAH box helicase [Thermoactinomyces sp. DSM 45892]|uniref:DEAD/DEAH box helicase n=1 Tax=Thermoactinomyces sp. DSM 45892 TaxID=1882753 RepID=UPI00089719E1|nr:DEAD/DEAH box helicase [Thermoactinomyces sp. DSM 45892]SDY22467.1 Superfamily II DNA or RNA helicase [Thermoactinomyces sp. DSM 45892]
MTNEIHLRPYQLEAHDAWETFCQSGGKRGLINLPTGCGKTITALALAQKMMQEKQGRMLWLAHREELIEQPIRSLPLLWPEATHGIVKANRNEMDKQCVFASVQTVYRRLDKLPTFDLIVVDEAHHALGKTYLDTLEAVGAFEQNGPPVVGLTATVERGDKKGLDSVFEQIIYQYPFLQAIRDGYLADLRTQFVKLDANFDEIRTVAGDLHKGDLEEVLLKADVAKKVADAYIQYASDRKAIVFTVSVDQAKRTAAELLARGIPAEWLSGQVPSDERKAILHRLKTGETKVLCNCAVLTEGFDEPTVDCIVMARPTKSRSLYIQMIGRGTRKAPLKNDCLVLDVTGVSKRHKLITAPVLFGIEENDKTGTITERLDWQRDRNHEISRLQSIFKQSQIENEEVQPNLQWLEAEPGVFALSVGGVGTAVMVQEQDGWMAKILKSNHGTERLTHHPVWRELAQGIIEDYVRKAGALGLVKQDASWRKKPASEKQMWALKRWGVRLSRWLTKGEAADEMTKAIARRGVGA